MTFPGYFLNFPRHTPTRRPRALFSTTLSNTIHENKTSLTKKKKFLFEIPWPFLHDFRQYFKFHDFSRPGILISEFHDFSRFPWPVRTLQEARADI